MTREAPNPSISFALAMAPSEKNSASALFALYELTARMMPRSPHG